MMCYTTYNKISTVLRSVKDKIPVECEGVQKKYKKVQI